MEIREVTEKLHLYLGCQCKGDEGTMTYTLDGFAKDCRGKIKYFLTDEFGNACSDIPFKPILRRLSSQTDDELVKMYDDLWTDLGKYPNVSRRYKINYCSLNMKEYEATAWLLKKGFWLWDDSAFSEGLILEKK